MRSRRNLEAASTPVTVRRHRPVYQLVLFMGLLLLLGLVVMYAIGPQRANLLNYAYGTSYDDNFFFNKQLVGVVLSIVAFGACAVIPHELFTKKYAKALFLTGLGLSFALVIFGAVFHAPFASEVNGAFRWFYLGSFGSFQPSELLKFGALLYIAGFLGMRAQQGKINNFSDTLMPLLIVAGASLFVVVVLQKDLGTGVSLTAIILSMLFVAGLDKRIMLKVLAILLAVGVLFIVSAPHRIERVMTFMQGDDNSLVAGNDNNYHITQARIAIGSGGLFGLGIGKSVQATGYLPEAINDSIFAIMGETFGLVGLVVILGIFTALLLSILNIASRLPDVRLRLVVVGVFGWVTAHVVLNVAAMTGVAPLTGISLPLLSYGGTSMLFIAAALGLVFQLSRYTAHKPLTEGGGHGQDSRSRRRLGRTRYASGRSI